MGDQDAEDFATRVVKPALALPEMTLSRTTWLLTACIDRMPSAKFEKPRPATVMLFAIVNAPVASSDVLFVSVLASFSVTAPVPRPVALPICKTPALIVVPPV